MLDLRVFFQHSFQLFQVVEIENFGLEVVLHHHVEAVCFGAQHNDGGADVTFAQSHAFVGVGYRQIIDMVGNQFVDELHIAETVGVCFHHGHHLGFRTQEGAVQVEVVGERGEADVEDSEMGHVLELGHDVLKMETACALDQNGFVGELRQIGQKFFCSGEELLCRASEA